MSGTHWLGPGKFLPGDDTPLTEGEGCEADVTRAVVVDEELQLLGRPGRAPPQVAGGEDGACAAADLADDEEIDAGPAGGYFPVDHLEQAKLLLSGGVAGAFSKSCTAPLARLTILYQVNGLPAGPTLPAAPGSSPAAAAAAAAAHPARLSVGQALRHVVRTEGLAALWKGNGVTIIHRLPYSAANFWIYEHLNELWKFHLPSQGPFAAGDVARRLVSGGLAGMSACALAYPLDLVRTRLAAQTSQRYYTGIGQALRCIVREEGARGLYRGLGPTLIQVAPSLAINYAAYETMRSAWLKASNRDTPTVAMSLACGSAAGIASSTATFPLDLIRRRLQLRHGGAPGGAAAAAAAPRATFRGTFNAVLQGGGVRGLYSGILPEYYKVVPGVAIAFCTYELMKKMLGVQTNATER